MQTIGLLVVATMGAFLLTGWLRRYALRARLLDVPNARSSHDVPTPRGGGLSLAIVLLTLMPALGAWIGIPLAALAALTLGGLAVAAVGWLDDHTDVPARWRMAVHLAAAVAVVALAGDIPALALPWGTWPWGWAGGGVLVLFVGWSVNLYNFMDGIDGIAGTEAVTVAGVAAMLLASIGAPDWALMAGLIAAAGLGFLGWNWPPARIFMGDAGSGLLGFLLASLAVLSWAYTGLPIWSWLILMGVFIVDATWTLGRRILHGERFWEAHRSHAYQHAARWHGAHRPVTVAVAGINLLWLAPLAWAATVWPQWGIALLAAAWLPLLLMALHYRAGVPG